MAVSVVDIGRRQHWPSSMLAGRGRRGWWRCRAGNRGRVSTSAIVVAVSVVDIGHLLHRLSSMSAIQQQAHVTIQWPSQWGLPRLNGCWGWTIGLPSLSPSQLPASSHPRLALLPPPAAFDFCDGHPPPLHSCPPVVVVITVIIPPPNLATTTTS
jgi:hypothetical protein